MTRILAVDDDPTILLVVKTILERSGFETMTANNGPDALALFRAHDIDVLLTDIVMPGMSGTELIVEARRLCPDLPICCMTAYNPILHRHLEGVLIISKPFATRKLINMVRRVLGPQRGAYMGGPSSGVLSRRAKSAKTRSKAPPFPPCSEQTDAPL